MKTPEEVLAQAVQIMNHPVDRAEYADAILTTKRMELAIRLADGEHDKELASTLHHVSIMVKKSASIRLRDVRIEFLEVMGG